MLATEATMADTDLQQSEQEQWGFTPGAPPALAQADPPAMQGPGPAPAPMPAPAPPRAGALDTGAPPQMPEASRWGTAPPPPALAQVDDNAEFENNRQDEINAYRNKQLSIIGNNDELTAGFTREQHPEFGKLVEAEAALSRIANPKEARALKPQVDLLRKRIDHEVQARDQQLRTQRREQLARDDAPYQSPDARAKTAEVIDKSLQGALSRTLAGLGAKDPATARVSDYDLTVSPLTTMSKPNPGADPKAKADGTNRDYTPLRDAATEIAVHNRGLSNDATMTYLLKLGTPGGGTDEKGNQLRGYNGRYGAGATNYKVIGRDEVDNVLVEMDDGKRLRVPGFVFRQITTARLQGVKRAKEWENDYKKSQEPSLLGRVLKSVIPEKGF
jgi:hypothetical protein